MNNQKRSSNNKHKNTEDKSGWVLVPVVAGCLRVYMCQLQQYRADTGHTYIQFLVPFFFTFLHLGKLYYNVSCYQICSAFVHSYFYYVRLFCVCIFIITRDTELLIRHHIYCINLKNIKWNILGITTDRGATVDDAAVTH
jgi:hypothetical protein